MIQTTPEGNQLLYKLIPIEVLFQLCALTVFMFYYASLMSETEALICAGAISIANLARLILVIAIKVFIDQKADGHSKLISSLLIVGNVLTGLCWSCSLVYLDWQVEQFSFNDNIVTIMLTGLIMTSLVGSALWSWLFLAFALPAVSAPLAWFIYNESYTQVAIWGFFATVVTIVFWVITRAESAFARYRSLGKQNTTLLKQLASANEQATRQHNEVEKAHESLKGEMKEREKIEEKIRASEKETTRILQDMQDTYFRVDAKGRLRRISPSINYLLGLTPETLEKSRFADLFASPTDYLILTKAIQNSCGSIENFEVRMRHSIGHEIWASFNAHLSGGPLSEGHQGFEGTIRDVTETKGAAEALYLEKERLHVTLESIGDGVITTDTNGTVVYLNPIAERMTGWNEDEAQGQDLSDVMQLIDEKNAKPLVLPLNQWLKEAKRSTLNNPAQLKHKSKSRDFTIELSGSPIRDSKGQVIGAVLVFHNVTKLRTLAKQLSYQASHDALTGLINRMEFETRVDHSIRSARNEDKHHALCYIDLDQFKIVNDTCGHHSGDELLKQVTMLMQDQLRASDTLARLGGDEFGILLVGCDIAHAQTVAENIRALVEKFRFVWEDHIFRIGTSIGLVPITKDTQSITELLSAADSACYVAKEGGRNMVHTYTHDDEAVAKQHGQMQWKERIQNAVEKNRFELYFQPIVPITQNNPHGLCGELLLRMQDDKSPDNQLIMPGAFMPAAERYQLMPEVDRWVIKNAFRILKQKLMTEKWDSCFINLSGQTLSDPKLLDFITAHLKKNNIPGHLICFEITESALIANIDNANRLISALKHIGCRFALDDFGSGVSSFAYLKNLSVDYLKLDGEIVKDVVTDKAGYAMVHAINQVAHVMNMKTIAEHVETQSIFDALRRLGADYAQGFGIAYPEEFVSTKIAHSKVS